MPAAMSPADTAIVTRIRTPCSSPQPIDPKIHSPRNSGRPIARSSPAKIAAPTASPPSAATRLISLPISSNSAFASSTWASTRRRPAAMVAAIWARSPGGRGGGGVEPGVRPLGGGGGGGGVADPPEPVDPGAGVADAAASDAAVGAGGPSPVPSGCSAGGGSTGSGLGGAGDCDSSSWVGSPYLRVRSARG
jgi:hypothetical protein